MYSPNQSTPDARIPGHACRDGGGTRLTSRTTPSATEAVSSRPSASAPGPKYSADARMETNAEAHITTVTAAADRAR